MTGLATGFPELDGLLPGGGWPGGALTEILTESQGMGALSLIMPALAGLSSAGSWLIWVTPPYIPYAPALHERGVDVARVLVVNKVGRQRSLSSRDALWTLEQGLRFQLCGAVLGWLPQASMPSLRRLQLAAEAGQSRGFVYRPADAAEQPSPAALRLLLATGPHGLRIRILKCRGSGVGKTLDLKLE